MRLSKNFFFSFFILLLAAAVVILVLWFTIFNSNQRKTGFAAIASNGLECAGMVRKIFEQGGNVADAAVTGVLCEGITSPQSSGIGGGFLLTLYLKDKKIVTTLNARERAPRFSTADMFSDGTSSTRGGKAVAVPGEMKGLWELHQKYGTLPWKDLIMPNVELCRNGAVLSDYLANIMENNKETIRSEPSMAEIFINPLTSDIYRAGDKVRRPKLADTLERIANEGIEVMYGGEIGRQMVEDVQARGGILTEKDLLDYRVEWRDAVSTEIINKMTLHAMPLPSSGAILLLMANLLKDFDMQPNALGYHRIAEAFKIGFAQRSWLGAEETKAVKELQEKLTSKEYADLKKLLINDSRTSSDPFYYEANNGTDIDDHGTAHLNILAPNGDAIAVTNTINNLFGAFFRSTQTGIILNDEMDDFQKPEGIFNGVYPSPNNFVIPYNCPISSMVPTIVTDQEGDVKMIIGGSGGRRILTQTFAVLFYHLYFNMTLDEAMAAPRIHHQLVNPSTLAYEPSLNAEIVEELRTTFGHELQVSSAIAQVTAISTMGGEIRASWDKPRRAGSSEIFEVEYRK